jgi:hypothetical protein
MYFLKLAVAISIYCFAFSVPLKYLNALKIPNSQKSAHFYKFRKTAWMEMFVSKKGAWLGKRGCMVALTFTTFQYNY